MDTRIQKWGNSFAVRIPKAYAEQMDLYPNIPVRISLEADRLVIEPVRRDTLADLLADVTPDNIHDETDWSSPN
jgi:antitoxin MazE